MVEEKEEKTKEPLKYELVEIPTQMGLAIQTPDKQHINVEQAMVEVLNKIDELHRKI